MSVSDPVADMLTKVRNASMARHEKVDIATSRMKLEIVKILKTEGYIKNFKKIVQDGQNFIRVFLKYDEADDPIIHGVERVSKPGRRVYTGYKSMPRVHNGFGTVVVSTSDGITTGRKAAERKVGGELICTIW
ncbi:MAG: 30S ribosomal protein S8 [Spirochaetes bacterium GWD1_61_31]|nr:MAG: 30S ribosomal protein S8 [Spirochaetes bacterium GWB1_60_80]OHD29917.1 MAG: 30S ribosomal protein S8 [Spirochaetes bacterium GWC1_61_12]OHD43774.1 MAG: 30S ribosomal protein S8 [Spirochaetes bacterium GWD1_61_31]OHD46016.1 MAG: 30S ribosomal protein S8 [Spirochaetes bacterium GWE1_60_18]OHD60588.1 MAG: 30S ribosomal protein S8 [Spirochaetes bacterium GWF1_60_12]HAP43426.1 30S ribosomal protein S8 [Spirochaetaceae bacterium]